MNFLLFKILRCYYKSISIIKVFSKYRERHRDTMIFKTFY